MKLTLSSNPLNSDSGGIIGFNIWYEEGRGEYMSKDAKGMQIGMLWKGEEGQTVFDIVFDAMKYYVIKYGAQPDLVYLNREMALAANQENRAKYLDANATPPKNDMTHFVFMNHKSEIIIDDNWQNGHIWIGVSR